MTRAILIHGNGNSKPIDNWLPYLKKELEKLNIKVDAPQFPDTELARSSYWLPLLENELKADDNTIIVGQDCLHTDYYESPDQGHFGGDYYKETFPELLEAIKNKIKK